MRTSVYTLPFYTNSVSLEKIVCSWTAEPLFAVCAVRTSASFWVKIISERPPVVFIALDRALLAEKFIERVRSTLTDVGYCPHIVALTESTAEPVIVGALQQGADRVLSLPTCSVRIFRSLVKSLLTVDHRQMCFAPYAFDVHTQTVSIGKKEIRLRHKSFSFAHFMFANNGRTIPKEDLLLEIWGLQQGYQTRRVESQVSYVKKKLFLDGTYGWTLKRRGGYGLFSSQAQVAVSRPEKQL